MVTMNRPAPVVGAGDRRPCSRIHYYPPFEETLVVVNVASHGWILEEIGAMP